MNWWPQIAVLAIVASAASGSQAQTLTDDPRDFFRSEADALVRHETPPPPPGFGPDAEYDGMAPTLPVAEPLPEPVALSFDPDAIGELPFGIERIDDPALLHFLEFYATEGRRRMSNWLARGGKYRSLLEPMLAEAGVPVDLFWIVAIESAFDANAESSAGAVGLWQFMRHTGRAYGLRIDSTLDQRRDPIAATRSAAGYFADLYETFGTWPLAFAAYNAGHGHVRGQIRECNATDFWELEDYNAIYTNARRYALRIMTVAIVDRNREVFGFDSLVADEPWSFDIVDVPGNVRLSLLGEAVDMSAQELREYNPELVGLRTPNDHDTWPLRIPPGMSDSFVAEYDRLRSRYGEDHDVVLLRFGESIDALAEAYDVPPRVLRSINAIPYDAPHPYGQEVLVPGRRSRQEPSSSAEPRIVLVPQTRFDFADRQRVFYETQSGDSLHEIARHFGVDVHHLAAWNDLDADGGLVSRLVLQVFIAPDFDLSQTVYLREDEVTAVALNSPEWVAFHEAEEAEAEARRRTYTVRSGDTVMAIAARFGVRTRDIVRWNDLGDEAMIIVGQELVVGR